MRSNMCRLLPIPSMCLSRPSSCAQMPAMGVDARIVVHSREQDLQGMALDFFKDLGSCHGLVKVMLLIQG